MLVYFTRNLTKYVVIDEDPERQRYRIINIRWVRNDARERRKVKLFTEDDDSVFPV